MKGYSSKFISKLCRQNRAQKVAHQPKYLFKSQHYEEIIKSWMIKDSNSTNIQDKSHKIQAFHIFDNKYFLFSVLLYYTSLLMPYHFIWQSQQILKPPPIE